MIVVRGTPAWRDTGLAGPVLTIGNFDGVHRGHRTLLDKTRAVATEITAPAAALTFDPAPRDVLRPNNGIPRIQSMARKLAHLGAAGLDAVIVQPFDLALASLEPAVFVERILARDLGVRALVVGHDFRFGHRRAGTTGDLRALGLPVHVVPPLTDGEGVVSSSRIRERIRAGEVAGAARLLGHDHEVEGVVVEGDRRGRTLGFPTANLAVEGGLLPADGVYAVRVQGVRAAVRTVYGRQRSDESSRSGAAPAGRRSEGRQVDGAPGVANLGTRPTFAEQERRLEVHLLDYEGDLYGQRLVVSFVERIRGEKRFESVAALRDAIAADAEAARRIVSPP